jgi:endo-1,4-beta-xylanase
VTAPSAFPIVLGTLATSGSATATFAISLQGCDSHSKFEVTAPWSSATYETGTFSTILDLDDHGGQNWW